MNAPPFQSTHKLDFLACPWPVDPEWTKFKIGTCEGAYIATEESYAILAIVNNNPGNGHFSDVLEWFENSCRRDGRNLIFLEMMNERLATHLVSKRGFVKAGDNVIKYLHRMKGAKLKVMQTIKKQ